METRSPVDNSHADRSGVETRSPVCISHFEGSGEETRSSVSISHADSSVVETRSPIENSYMDCTRVETRSHVRTSGVGKFAVCKSIVRMSVDGNSDVGNAHVSGSGVETRSPVGHSHVGFEISDVGAVLRSGVQIDGFTHTSVFCTHPPGQPEDGENPDEVVRRLVPPTPQQSGGDKQLGQQIRQQHNSDCRVVDDQVQAIGAAE